MITLPSGNVLYIGKMPIEECAKFHRLLLRELKNTKIGVSVESLKDLKNLQIDALKDVLFEALGNESINAAFWSIAKTSSWSKKDSPHQARLNLELFEDEAAQDDYYPILWEVVKSSQRPFTKSLLFLLSGKPKDLPESAQK